MDDLKESMIRLELNNRRNKRNKNKVSAQHLL